MILRIFHESNNVRNNQRGCQPRLLSQKLCIRNILVHSDPDPLIIPLITGPVPDPTLFLWGFQDAKENKKNSYIFAYFLKTVHVYQSLKI